MRRLLSCITALAIFSGVACAAAVGVFGPSPAYPPIVAEADSAGPDAFGYKMRTSTDPGGPPVQFVPLQGTGTLVTGLGDDNYVGPFNLGFNFQYYWYTVNQMWISSNGLLMFSSPYNITQPFPDTIPSPLPPNNFLAPYMADWDFTAGGSCYRWTNNVDSAIIEWYQTPAWSYGGQHTFEIIVTNSDSSITFNYGAQQGLVSNSDLLIGIENLNGLIGLQYTSPSLYPPSNFAMKFYYPDTVTFAVHDLEAYQSVNSGSQGFFLMQGTSFTPTGVVRNVGNQNEAGYIAQFVILKDSLNGTVLYSQSVTGGSIVAGEEQTVTFPAWTAALTGQYAMKLTVTLNGDMNPANNTKITEGHITALPGTLLYDDGLINQTFTWITGGALANHFVPPAYPAYIDCVRYFVGAGSFPNPTPFQAKILDDDGPGGNPGTVLWSGNISTPATNQWVGAMPNVVINSGGFYVAWFMTDSTCRPLGVDNTPMQPKSRQCWEYIGAWAPYRDLEISDLMIRTRMHSTATTPDLDVELTPINPPIVIPGGGGQFSLNATVQRLLPPQTAFNVWSRDRFPDGTYSPILMGPVLINPPVGQQVTRLRVQNVPGTWPAGVHYYIGYANPTVAYPAVDADSFPWTKSADAGNGPFVWDATCSGELFPGEQSQTAVIPSDLNLGISPNPFNPVTAISYQLSALNQVSLRVYDTAGRLVSTLVDGQQEAGTHSVTFDGSKLSSGLYFVKMQAGDYTAVQKIMLLK